MSFWKPTQAARAPAVPVLRPEAARFRFPDSFLWGASTSAHQVEGGNTNNDWSAWEEAGHVSVSAGAACDHFHRFRVVFDLARWLQYIAHRFSLVWSLIMSEEVHFTDEGLRSSGV